MNASCHRSTLVAPQCVVVPWTLPASGTAAAVYRKADLNLALPGSVVHG